MMQSRDRSRGRAHSIRKRLFRAVRCRSGVEAGSKGFLVVRGPGQEVRPGFRQPRLEAFAGLVELLDGAFDVLALLLEGDDAFAALRGAPRRAAPVADSEASPQLDERERAELARNDARDEAQRGIQEDQQRRAADDAAAATGEEQRDTEEK